MRILVTGGAGFSGSHFVRHVLSTSDDLVTVFDALTYAGSLDNLSGALDDRRVRFVRGDVVDSAAVQATMPGHQAVVHFAAESHVDRSLADPDLFFRTNCNGTEVLCDEAGRAGVERFVHVSTDEVYGSIDRGAFAETAPLRPTSPYAASKARSDLIALSHGASMGLSVSVTRSSNQFGPFQFPEKLIPRFVTTLIDGGCVPLYGDGGNARDWLFVEDNARAIDRVLRRGTAGEIYNIGGHNERTNLQVTQAILACLDLDESRIAPVADRPGHDRRYALDTVKGEGLGIERARSFEPALEATVRWYCDNERWWRAAGRRVELG